MTSSTQTLTPVLGVRPLSNRDGYVFVRDGCADTDAVQAVATAVGCLRSSVKLRRESAPALVAGGRRIGYNLAR